eukprot:Gregarina_sp_Pseudo_9__5610@NODE_76_length_4572_cov_104_792632_g70_i0_p1_GENE_NODE_76_length_4572_cov_104_792632_g70_i0NODE_76_length_4572_cov_104_792632_g70_i0_p1_ORF_typecomplete_len452_score123_21DMT_YdcZ/PF04657_13/2_1e08DMT_YdcZ/PF04657_13/3e16Ni_hydr_CYTB/PF01292_20/0_12Ni_hydr_CYTB/PF01292_20/8_9e02_NODE_76_length_4572_cov_104_792632_g70_i04971852
MQKGFEQKVDVDEENYAQQENLLPPSEAPPGLHTLVSLGKDKEGEAGGSSELGASTIAQTEYFHTAFDPEENNGGADDGGADLEGWQRPETGDGGSGGGWRKAVLYAFPFSVGLIVPFLGGLNNQLQDEIGGNVYFTVSILYVLAWVLTGLWTWFTTKTSVSRNYFDLGAFVFSKPLHFFCLTGGIAGIGQHVLLTIVSSAGGAGVWTLGSLLGSIVTSIFLDVTGTCWAKKGAVGFFAYLGGTAVAAGAIVHSLSDFLNAGDGDTSVGGQVGFILLSMLGGFLLCFQSCVMQKFGEVCGEFRRSVVFTYFSGALVLLFIAPYTSPSCSLRTIVLPRNWWKVSQTLLVIWCTTVVTIFQFKLNAAVVYCYLIVGQLLSSTLIDSLGWIGLDQRPLTVFNIVGLVIVVLGIALVTFDKLHQDSKLQKGEPQGCHWPTFTKRRKTNKQVAPSL